MSMDPVLFREAYNDINQHACAFEKSVLSGRCGCDKSERFCLAEREGIQCNSHAGQTACLAFLKELRQQTRFFLKTPNKTTRLPHAKAIQMQVGSMRGLFTLHHPTTPFPLKIESIHQILSDTLTHYGSLNKIPYQPIIHEISEFIRSNKRSSRKKHRNPKSS